MWVGRSWTAAAALFIATAPPWQAKADLKITADAEHTALFQHVYQGLPCCWKTDRSVSVQELSPTEMDRLLAGAGVQTKAGIAADGSRVDGCYQPGDSRTDAGKIYLCPCMESRKCALIFAHEYGHFVWEQKLTRKDRARHTAIWRDQKRRNSLITRYAADTPEEGFAEDVAYFLVDPSLLRERDPAGSQFLTGLVGPTPLDGSQKAIEGNGKRLTQ